MIMAESQSMTLIHWWAELIRRKIDVRLLRKIVEIYYKHYLTIVNLNDINLYYTILFFCRRVFVLGARLPPFPF